MVVFDVKGCTEINSPKNLYFKFPGHAKFLAFCGDSCKFKILNPANKNK